MVLPPVKFIAKRMAINILDDFLYPELILPPLFLNINPQTLKKSYKNKITRSHTFGAYVEEHWGQELDRIASSNTTGGFLHETQGLTNLYKTQTSSYFKFQDFLDIYKNSGNIYDDYGIVVKRGTVVITYDGGLYYGYFEKLDWGESATDPFKINFNFDFVVEKSYEGI